MDDLGAQTDYWDAVSGLHDCTLQPPLEVLADYVPKSAKIVDIGCGYGRSMADLAGLGFHDLTGFDPSPKMIERGRAENPGLDLRLWDSPVLPVASGSVDAALLVGVLTGVPEDQAQIRLVGEAERILCPGGVLLLCDFPLQDDERNLARYALYAAKYAKRGVFELDSGAVMRHHDPAWLDELTAGFTRLRTILLSARTLTGRPAKALCLVLGKPAAKAS